MLAMESQDQIQIFEAIADTIEACVDDDIDKNGVKSDHRIVVARPINTINNKCGRQTRTVHFQSLKWRR